MNKYVHDPKSQVWIHKGHKSFDYSDGDEAENYISEVVKAVRDVSCCSDELNSKIKDWPSEYHLSQTRHNLLIPLNIKPNTRILELSCGLGTITRYLGEIGAQITAVEGSFRRAAIARERCRDLSNVKVICDNFKNFEADEKFDIVTLIGVLEYSPKFMGEGDQFSECLKLAGQHMKADGALVIAIENRLGLKYFNGCTEDHTRGMFDSIHDNYLPNTVRTLGYGELKKLISNSGFHFIEFLFPFPDYKLPIVILNEKSFTYKEVNCASMIGQVAARDYSGQEYRFFSERLVWQSLERNGCIPQFSNSFLIIAHRSEDKQNLDTDSWIAKIYSNYNRRPCFKIETTIQKESDSGKIIVRKERLFKHLPVVKGPLKFNEAIETNYISGELFSDELARLFLCRDPYPGYIQKLIEYKNYLIELNKKYSGNMHAKNFAGQLIDCLPFNIIRKKDGTLHYIDDEWVIEERMPLSYIFMRGVLNELLLKTGYIRSLLFFSKYLNLKDILAEIFRKVGIGLSSDDYKYYCQKEALIKKQIYGSSESVEEIIRQNENRLVRPIEEVLKLEHKVSFWENCKIKANKLVGSTIPDEKNHSFKNRFDASDKEREFSRGKGQTNRIIESCIKLIAFYLPQFHPIPENDEWWGKGFTEWTNVSKSTPQFPGHYQPHIPADLGFYDLRLPEVRKAQADLAKEYGIQGFCYYHYWFNGKLLLERPLQEMLKSGEPDFPFCMCWANENWTRAWDGGSDQILIQQNYNEKDDLEHIRYLCQIFQDRRYIKIDGKPLFLVYRANSLPDPLKTTSLWREEARRLGLGEMFLCRVESFPDEHTDPKKIGFDASVEFQPDWTELGLRLQDDQYGDHCVYQYENVVERMLKKEQPEYKRFPCVTPSWDNTPRRKNGATVFIDSTPQLYENWLKETIGRLDSDNHDENIVFINAWNEWGEGNHLEPDLKFGRSYLEATKRALAAESEEDKKGLAEAYASIQQIFIQSGKYEEAIYALEKLLESHPGYALAYNDLGVLYYNKGEKGKALFHYEKAVALAPANATFQKNLADFFFVELGKTEEALRHYRNVLSIQPKDLETLLVIGNILASLKKFFAAKEYYQKALEVDPSNANARENLKDLERLEKNVCAGQVDNEAYWETQSLIASGKDDEAVQKLEALLRVRPEEALAHNDLGFLYYRRGEKKQALFHYEKAVQIAPRNLTALKNLADFYYVEAGRIEEALKIYHQILADHPDDVETLLAFGHICAQLDRFDDAISFCRRVLEIDPANVLAKNILENLQRQTCVAQQDTGDAKQALPQFKEAPAKILSKADEQFYKNVHVKDGKDDGIICLQPFYFMEFLTDGNISTCCPAWSKLSIGNARGGSIAAIWNSAAAQNIRRQIYNGNWQAVCNPICPHIAEYSYQNKIIKFSDLEHYDFLTPQLIGEIKARKTFLDSFPTVFNLSNSPICNLSCIMCSRHSDPHDPELAQKTSEDVFKHLDKAKRIILTGMGDPLARPDSRRLILEYRGNHLKFDLITNALLLPKYWEQMKHQNFGNLLISMDAAGKETYEKIRIGGLWEDLMESLALVKENRGKFDSITVNMTVMRQNYPEIPDFINLAATYGFNTSFQRIRGRHGNQNIFEMKDQTALEDLRKIIIGEQCKTRSMNVYFGDLLEFAQEKSHISGGKDFIAHHRKNEIQGKINNSEIKATLVKVKKANKTLSALESQSQSSAIKSFPLTAIVSVGSKCNLNCIMCHRTIHKVPGKNLPISLFQKAEDIFPTLEMVKLIGAGEPFLNPDYFKMLEVAKKYDLKTETVSNGTLISEEMASKITVAGLDSLAISLDGAIAKTYESIRKGAKLAEVIKNIKYINHFKKENNMTTPVLGFSTVIMKRNIEEVPKLLDIAADLGVSWITVLYLTVFAKELIGESLFFHQELSNDILLGFKEKAKRLGIGVDVPELFNKKQISNYQFARKKCYEPWQMVLIESGGEVIPCCTYGEAMGNLNESNFMEIWNNEKYRDLRRRVNSDDQPLPCRHCSNSTVAHNVNDIKAHIKCPIPPELATKDQKEKVVFIDKKVFQERNEQITQNGHPLKEVSQLKSGKIDQIQKGYNNIREIINDGKNEEAIIAMARLLELNPDYDLAHNDLGFLYYQRGEKGKALVHYERAVKLNPKNLTALKNLADFYYVEAGRIEEALKIYHQILADHPDDVETLLAFAQISINLNRLGDALSFYQRILKVEPQNIHAQKMVIDLKQRMPQNPEHHIKAGDPRVSMIIPIVEDLIATVHPIGTILQNTEYTNYEIVLVAKGLSESEQKYATSLKNDIVKIFVAPDNMGIVEACNVAAEKASGDYLVFMDSRVILSKGWLAPLLKAARFSANAGSVAAKVIRTPQSILEAGYSYLQGNTIKGYGDEAELDCPKYDYLNTVESGSRYLMLVSKSSWQTCGKFDQYISDFGLALIDLGFSLRAGGKTLLYQPLCVIGLAKDVNGKSTATKTFKPHPQTIKKLRPQVFKVIGSNGDEKSASRKRILVLGIYLAQTLNNVEDIVSILSDSEKYDVTQRWVGLGEEAPTQMVAELTVKTIMGKKPKYEIMNDLLSEEDLTQYEYVLMTDDDVILPEKFIDQFIRLQAELDFVIAQPARTSNSYIDHPIVEQHRGLLARQTHFVEIGPVVSFHKSVFSFIFPFDLISSMGWGYENVWSHLLSEKGMKMGIIDNIPVDHSLRKPVENYDWNKVDRERKDYLAQNKHIPLEDCFRIVQIYNI